jgi:hypothetical protein
VTQALLVASLVRGFTTGTRWRPALSLGTGVSHVRAAGTAMAPHEAATDARTGLAGEVGGELALDVGGAWQLVARAAAVVYQPSMIVRIAGVEAARLGRPSVGLGLAVRWRAGR